MARPGHGKHDPPPPPDGKNDHHAGFNKAMQNAIDDAVDNQGLGGKYVSVTFGASLKKNPGGVGQYHVFLTEQQPPS